MEKEIIDQIEQLYQEIKDIIYDDLDQMATLALEQSIRRLTAVQNQLSSNEVSMASVGGLQLVMVLLYDAMGAPGVSSYDQKSIFDCAQMCQKIVHQIMYS